MTSRPAPLSRRGLLTSGAVAGLGAAAGAGALAGTPDRETTVPVAPPDTGTATVPFHGPRQAGIAEDPPAHAAFVAVTLAAGVDRRGLARMLRLLTDDAARLTQGVPAPGDTEAALAVLPARLTLTFGFGPGLYAAAGLRSPVADLPGFRIDRLERRWSGCSRPVIPR